MRSQREDHHQQSTLGKAVDAIGGAALFGVKTAGVAYGAYRLSRGIGAGRILDYAADGSRKLNSALEATSGVVEGFMRTIDSAGWKETFTGRATNELRENLTSSLRKWGNGQRGVIGGEMLRTERLGLDLRKMLDYSAEEAENVVRRQKILDKVAKTPGYNPEIANVVESLVSPGSSAFQAGYRIQQPGRSASDVSREAFDRTVRNQNLRKKFNGSEQDVLNQTLNNLRQVMSDTAERKDFVAQYGNEINTGTKKLQAQFVEAMLSNANKTYGGNEHQGFFAKVLAKAGPDATVRRATYRDLYTHAENPLDLRKVERTGQSSRAFFESLRDRVSEIDPRLASRMDNMVVDPNLYIGGTRNRLIDMRGLVRGADRLTETLGREIQVPFVGIRPLSLMRPFVPKDPNEYVSHIFNPGSVINTGKTFAAQSRRTAYYAGQMLNLDYKDGQLAVDVTKDVYLTRFGAHRRALMNMDPTSRYSSTFDELAHDPRLRGRFRNVFDLGMNESRGFVGNVLSIATKFSDPTWTRNMVSGLENGSLLYHTTGYLQGARAKSVRILEQKAGTLTRNQLMEAQDLITKRFGQDFFNALTTGSTEQSTMNAIESLIQMKDASSLVGKDQVRQLERYLAQYKANPDVFSHIKNAHEELNESVLDNLGNAINLRASTPVRYGDKYRQDLQASILHAILPDTQRSTIASVFKGATAGDITDILDLSLYGRFSSWGDDTESLRQMAGFISGKNYLGQQNILDQDARARFIKIADHAEPVFGFGPQPKPSSVVGAETPVLIRKSNVGDTLIRGINDNILNGSFDLKDPLSMFGPIGKVAGQTLNQLYRESGFGGAGRAGRGNLDQVTEVTTAFYNTFNRLNEYLQAASFGLSKRHTGSAQDLALNLVGRRYILPAMMLGYMAYGNDLIGNITGTEPTDAAVQGYAGISLGVQKVKDVTGLNSFGRWMERLTPGSEQLWGSPMLSPLKWASFGLLGDNRGYEELHDYYTTGNEPVRRGRWWEFGSNTPWTGGRVMGFRPSFYRRALGEPTMTDSLWGSENEYWANNALPTLHNPLGPLKTWVLDPYHWEKKHQYDQPTPVYGGIPEFQAMPIIGPALDSTVGRVFKPIRTNWRYFKDHRQYIKEINEAIKADEEQRSRGSILYHTGGGRMTFKGIPDELDVEVGPNGEVLGGSGGIGDYGMQGLSAGTGLSPVYMPLASGSGAATTAQTLRGINLGLTDVKNLRGLGSRNLNDLIQSNLLDRIDSVSNPYNLLFQGNETMYQVRELMGLRGFALGQLFGEDFGKPDMVLQSSSRAYGYERRFWDQQMGGLGGDFSEAMRRFLPHRQRDVQEYNPMQNNMPDWLPSNLDYFQDFQHGNPYCVSKDTLIEINELEFIRADQVVSGQIITTHKGNQLPVQYAVGRQVEMNEKVYSFNINSLYGTTVEMSEEHPVLVLNIDRSTLCYDIKRKEHKPRTAWRMAKDIRVGDYVAYPVPRFDRHDVVFDLHDLLPEKSYSNRYVYVVKHPSNAHLAYEYMEDRGSFYFARGELKEAIDQTGYTREQFECAQTSERLGANNKERVDRFIKIDEDIAYLCGIYISEGWANNSLTNLSHHIKEKSYSMRAVVGAQKIHGDAYCTFSQIAGTNGATTLINSTIVSGFLTRLIGCGFDKKRIPNEFAHLDEASHKALLKGIFDGDGSLFYSANSSGFNYNVAKYQVSIKLKNKPLLLQIRKLLLMYGFVLNLNNDYTGTLRGMAAIKFASWLGYDIPSWINPDEFKTKERTWTIITEDYIYLRVAKVNEIDTVDRVYGFQVGSDQSFCIAGIATHNTTIPFGESMLPGEGYESINKLHPDAYFGRYGAIDRMRILANAAPWSEQYKYYSRVVSQMHAKGLYTEDEYRLAQRARDEARLKKQKYRFYGYKFKDNEIDRDTVTIDRMIDPFTFTTVERPGEVFRLAGISGPKSPNTEAGAEVNALASQYLQAGQRVTVGVSRDPVGRVRRDTLGTTRAVVWSNGVKVNKALLDAKGVKADYDSTDPASIHALYNPLERTIGSAWESIAHLDNPINNKFLQVRSPLEMYERNFVYGKEFQSWDHPISDWLVPTINKMSKNNPLVATGTGALLGSMFVKSKHGKVIGAAVGGTVGLVGTGGRVLNEAIGRIADPLYTWIPAEERRIREVEEYFDMLKYVKFKGLYERAARAAYKYEGLDVDRLLDQMENGTAGNKSEVRRLQKVKRMIKLSMGDTVVNQEDAKARLEAINQRLNELTGLKEGVMLGPIATQAIQYKQQYEQTLAGADPNGDLANILAALPKRDRAFFQEFMNAKPEEREKILRLVPKNQRRFYQAKWGMKVDRPQNPLSYFLTHNLPGASWHGWEPDADLDEIKLKFINQEGMDLDRFGAWESEMSQVDENTPELSHMSGFILDTFKLKDVLEGRGISNLDIYISSEQTQDPTSPFTIDLQMSHDRRPDVVDLLNKNISMLLR